MAEAARNSLRIICNGRLGRNNANRHLKKRRAPAAARSRTGKWRSTQWKKKLSYLESRDLDSIQERIIEAERVLAAKHALLEEPAVIRDPQRLRETYKEMEEAKATVEQLYTRWAELEQKIS